VQPPAPSPAPVDPKPRETRKAERADVDRPSYSAARRYARLDNGRRELTNELEAPIQALLRQIIRALPKDRNMYIISFSSVRDTALASEAAGLTAIGLEMIDGRPVVLDSERLDDAAGHNFILVTPGHELARFADLDVLVLTRAEAAMRPDRSDGQIVLVLDAAPRAHVASNENVPSRLAV
jgi:hypothetical protein